MGAMLDPVPLATFVLFAKIVNWAVGATVEPDFSPLTDFGDFFDLMETWIPGIPGWINLVVTFVIFGRLGFIIFNNFNELLSNKI